MKSLQTATWTRFAGKNPANVPTQGLGVKPGCNTLQCAAMAENFAGVVGARRLERVMS